MDRDFWITTGRRMLQYVFIAALITGLSLGIVWCANGGFIVRKPLTTDYQSWSNEIMRAELVGECNEVTGTVVDFMISRDVYDVYIDLGDEFSFVSVRVYGKKDQVKYLEIGDTVRVTGKLNYHVTYNANDYPVETLSIGQCIGVPPFAFRANITKINDCEVK